MNEASRQRAIKRKFRVYTPVGQHESMTLTLISNHIYIQDLQAFVMYGMKTAF
jgi:hypothetical protein